MGRPRTWTADRDAQVVAMRARGLGHAEIATALLVSVKAIRHRIDAMRAAGTIAPAARRWTTGQVRLVDAMASAGATNAEIAAALGRSIPSVVDMRSRYGIRSPVSGDAWTEAERATVADMNRRGFTAREIADHIGRSRAAVRMELWRARQRDGA